MIFNRISNELLIFSINIIILPSFQIYGSLSLCKYSEAIKKMVLGYSRKYNAYLEDNSSLFTLEIAKTISEVYSSISYTVRQIPSIAISNING